MRPVAVRTLNPEGPAAAAAAELWWLMLILGIAVFVLFAALLGVGLFRHPRRGEAGSPADDRPSVGRWIIGGGVVLPLVVVTVVLVATLQAMRGMPAASSDALVIEIVGHQFWYEIHYPGQGVTLENELHMPVGRPVEFRLTSADVIHSFWVPALGGKMDMLPDGVNTLVLQADVPGEHRVQCAEFCGLHHTDMTMVVVAEPEEDFAAWLADRRGGADPPATARDHGPLDAVLTQGGGHR